MQDAPWYFDFVSPFAYLQWKSRARLAGHLRLIPRPVVLGALLTHHGQKGPAEIPGKRFHSYRSCLWRARALDIPFRLPPFHPFNPIPALRLAVALGASEAVIDAVFDAAYRDGRDVSDPATISEIGASLGLDDVPSAISQADVKQTLRQTTEEAIARGLFGVPTLLIGDEMFWGEDTTDLAIEHCDNSALFDSTEIEALRQVPSAFD